MNEQIELIEGTNRDVSLSQWFTPPELAARVVEWAGIADPNRRPYERGYRVLEPSAGNGALVRPLVAAGAQVVAVELDTRYYEELRSTGAATWIGEDFLQFDLGGWPQFDLCVMNPPYEDGKDVAFILHALKFAPRVVGVFRSQILHGVERKAKLWRDVRPTRIAYCSGRPFKGAETDYVVLELVKRDDTYSLRHGIADTVTVEWW